MVLRLARVAAVNCFTAFESSDSRMGVVLSLSISARMAVCAKAIQTNVVPPTINYENPDPQCDLDYVPNTAREMPVNAVINNSFGFGGHNATLLARRFVG